MLSVCVYHAHADGRAFLEVELALAYTVMNCSRYLLSWEWPSAKSNLCPRLKLKTALLEVTVSVCEFGLVPTAPVIVSDGGFEPALGRHESITCAFGIIKP